MPVKNEIDMKQPTKGAASAQWIGASDIKLLEEQNIACKNMLAEVLKKEVHDAQLDYFEYYQNRFLELDEKVRRLKADLQRFETPAAYRLHQQQHITAAPDGLAVSIKVRYDELCRDMTILGNAFRTYLSDRLPG